MRMKTEVGMTPADVPAFAAVGSNDVVESLVIPIRENAGITLSDVVGADDEEESELL